MNVTFALTLFVGCWLCGGSASAGGTRIEIAVTPKKENGEKVRQGNVMKEETRYQYAVKLSNRSFAAANSLSAQYRIFVRGDSGKGANSQQKLSRQEFQATIPDLPNGGSYTFDTEPVALQKSTLDSGRYYLNGSRNRAADKVAGVWIRIFQDGKVVGEYLKPSTLAVKEKF